MEEPKTEEDSKLEEGKEVWTTENDSNGNETNLSNRYFETTCQTKDCLRAAANLLQSMDRTVDPCDDFYKFTCGNWAEEHPKPDSSSSYDWFNEKQSKILRKIRSFLQSNVTREEPTSVSQAKIMYRACMDIVAMDKLGLQPVIDYLKKWRLPSTPTILNVTDNHVVQYLNYSFDWVQSIAVIKKQFGGDLIIGFDIFPDPTNRTIMRIVVGTPESEAILPFKTKYEKILAKAERKQVLDEVDDDEDNESVEAYKQYIAEVMATLVFYDNPSMDLEKHIPNMKTAAETILKISKTIHEMNKEAENSTVKIDNDPLADLVFITARELQNHTDSLILPKSVPIWKKYMDILFGQFKEVQLDLNSELLLTSKPDIMYLQNVVKYLSELPALDIELYIWWNVVEELVLHTTSDIRKLHNEYARKITKLEGGISRSEYCTGGVNKLLGMAVSYAIATPDFLIHTRPKVVTMLNNIREAFNNLVRETTWMDDGTKCSTLEKSNAMDSLIGFPDWIVQPGKLDSFYSGIKCNETTHLKNMMTVVQWEMERKLRMFKMTDEYQWATTPTNVNAFHTFQSNAISRMFDKEGNLRQWWTNKTIHEYVNRTGCFINQYNGYYLPEISEYINGELTLGENIADNGGLREAFHAYQLYKDTFGYEPKLPGFEDYTHEQLLFISFGNLWCETQTMSSIKWAQQDTHSPGRIRLLGVLSNSPEFSDTFKCKRGSGMYPLQRCRIW
ncbi:hypothetical protein HA402_008803 [Bradysia odoriphaga]|nr:hypothetical protein HA402_008803 [Bradysia odoriphaga]